MSEIVDQPVALTVYPGVNAKFLLYEDDGTSFNYRRGEWMGIEMDWKEISRSLQLSLAAGSRVLPPSNRDIEVRVGQVSRKIVFDGTLTRLDF
ncbi:MAG: DUF5110 domain-containing protein [Acidobacteria bacterium]|nr:DUF5110 domain-containing protein [Acidobacteriota bacterium]